MTSSALVSFLNIWNALKSLKYFILSIPFTSPVLLSKLSRQFQIFKMCLQCLNSHLMPLIWTKPSRSYYQTRKVSFLIKEQYNFHNTVTWKLWILRNYNKSIFARTSCYINVFFFASICRFLPRCFVLLTLLRLAKSITRFLNYGRARRVA